MNILTMALALLFVIALMVGMAWLVKKIGFSNGGQSLLNPNPAMKVIETLSLDSKRRLFLVDIAGVKKVLLLGMGTEQCLDIDVKELPVKSKRGETKK